MLLKSVLSVVSLWYYAPLKREQTVAISFGGAQGTQLVGQYKNSPNKKLQPTVYAVSFVCMLAALPFSHTNATAYTATECGVMRNKNTDI